MAATQNRDMGSGSIPKLLAQLALPAVVAQVVNLLYNIVDRIYIGHMPEVGASALTGVGLFTPILMLITAFAMLCGSGGAPRAAIAMGRGDDAAAERLMGHCFTQLQNLAAVIAMRPNVARMNEILEYPLQTGSDLVHTVSFQILPVNAFDHFGLGRINDQMAFRVLRIAEKPIVIDLHLSVLVAELQTQLHILAQRLTFLLGQRCHDRNQNFSLGVHSVDGFLLEIDRIVLFFELADVFQAVQCIAGKPADGLGNNHVDVPSHAFVNHAVEFGALFGVGTGDP